MYKRSIHPGIRGTLSVGVGHSESCSLPAAAQTITACCRRNREEQAFLQLQARLIQSKFQVLEMTVSDLVQNVACRDPHIDVTDVLTYLADKGAET